MKLNRKGTKDAKENLERLLELQDQAKFINFHHVNLFLVNNLGFVFPLRPLRPFSSAFALKSFDFDLRFGIKHI